MWVWEKRVTGTCSCDPGYAIVVVQANGSQLEVPREDRRFSVVVPLSERNNHIAASCRHHDGLKCEPARVTFRQRLKARPTAVIQIQLDSEHIYLDGSTSKPNEASNAPIAKYEWKFRKNNPERLSLRLEKTNGAQAEFALPSRDGEYYVSLKITDAQGRSDTAMAVFLVEKGVPKLPDLATENPGWVEQAVIYGVVPHNIGPHGLRSVTARLDYLKELGIDAIWLSPCTHTKGGGHGYAVSDYFRLRRDYGSKRDFHELVKAAHDRGIRVLMDFVPNHTSVHHPYMQHVLKHGKASPYHSFYEWHDDGGSFAYYFHWRHLPNLNYDNPEVRRLMTEAFSYWVREFDIDGFRVDAAWGVKLRCPEYWPEWRRELKRLKPDLLLLAEASAREHYWFDHGFDAAYDWTYDLGKWSMEFVFEDPDQIVSRLQAALTNEGRGFHEDALIFRFLNNNDTGPRFLTRYGVEMEKVAAAMLLTLPGLPCIYTGQEVGAEFEPYKTSGPISWENRFGLYDYYKQLIALRHRFPSLHSRQWEILPVSSEQQVFAYARYADVGNPPVLVLLNFSRARAKAKFELPKQFAAARRFTDLLSGQRVGLQTLNNESVSVTLPGLCARLLVAERKCTLRA